MEEGAEEERVTPADRPDEEVEEKQKAGGEGEEEGSKISDQRDRRAEGEVKKNEANEKKDDEKRRASGTEEDNTKEEVPKSQLSKEQKDKEPSKKAPISSFFGEEAFAQLGAATLTVLQCGSTTSSLYLLLYYSKSSPESCC